MNIIKFINKLLIGSSRSTDELKQVPGRLILASKPGRASAFSTSRVNLSLLFVFQTLLTPWIFLPIEEAILTGQKSDFKIIVRVT